MLAAQAILDGFGQTALFFTPAGRDGAQLRVGVGFSAAQFGLQKVGEQMVVAVPAPLIVERNQEQIAALHFIQQQGAAVVLHQRIAQPGGEPRQCRGAQQKTLNLKRLNAEYGLEQVFGQVFVASGKRGDHGPGVAATAADGQRGELQAGGPAFGGRVQAVHRIGFKLDGVQLQHEFADLGGIEVERLLRDFMQPTGDAPAPQLQAGAGTAGQNQAHVARGMGDQAIPETQDAAVREVLEVIDENRQFAVGATDAGDQRIEQGVVVARGVGLDEGQLLVGRFGVKMMQCRDQVFGEHDRFVVIGIHTQPATGVFVLCQACRQFDQQG